MVAGLIVFVLYLYFFVGVDELVYALQRVNTLDYLFFYSLAIATMLLSLFCWTASWQTILQTLSIKLGLKKAFQYFWVTNFIDLLVPSETIGGEVTRLYLVHYETKGDLGSIAASAITNRIVEYIIVTVGLSSTVALFLLNGDFPPVVSDFLLFVLIGALIYLAILLALALSEQAAEVIASIGTRLIRILRRKEPSSVVRTKDTKASLTIFYRGFRTFREKTRRLIKPLVFQLTSFLLNLSVYVLIFYALGFPNLPFEFFILTSFIASAIQDATASLSIGSLDITLITVFTLYGIPLSSSTIIVAVLRSVTYWFPLLIGYVMVQIIGAEKVLGVRSFISFEAQDGLAKLAS